MEKYKDKIILGLSNINADFLQLILCMFVSHYILDNPLYGASLFLFANIWTLYFHANLKQFGIKINRTSKLTLMFVLLILSVIAGLAIVFIYPFFMHKPRANLVSFFVLLLAARTNITYIISKSYQKRRWFKLMLQLLFMIPLIAYAYWIFDGIGMYIVIGGCLITGFLLSYQSDTLAAFTSYMHGFKDKLKNISSYEVFTNMSLYSQAAFSLGVLMYICYISFNQTFFFEGTYIMMAVWLIIVLFSSDIFSWFVDKRGWVMRSNLFIIGALFWILGSIQMFGVTDVLSSAFWTLFWGFGLACVNASMNHYNGDFKMVAGIANKKVEDEDLYFRSFIMQIVSVIFSNSIMLCILTFWTFVIPNFSGTELPGAFKNIMIQLPVLLMLVGIFFALRQPLDRRNREKLQNYYKGVNNNKPTKQNLEEKLVKKSKAHSGIKIIAAIVRPFLHLKVSGKENLDTENYPSIFVCNHGILYGPVAAVIYLPTYFRPWVDKKMVERDLAANEMYNRFIYAIPLLSEKAKRKIAYWLAGPVTWAINSFNPIPVERDNLRNVMSTFNATVDALVEGDNVLIFPERPRKVKVSGKETAVHETATVGSLFTGFANIGKMYHEKTGKSLRFYPIYANKKGHTFKIGSPVIFDPLNESRNEKQRIAQELHDKMLELNNDLEKK